MKWMARILFLAVTASTSVASAVTYTYQSLYDQADIGFPDVSPPSLNDAGTVAFLGTLGEQDVIVKGSGGPLTVIATEGPIYSAFSRTPAINNSGLVVFSANRTAGNPGILVSDGSGQATNINGTLTGDFTTNLGVPSINDSGQVAFVAENGDQTNIYIGSGGTPTMIGPAGGTVDINNSTVLVWSATGRIRQWNAGTTSTLVDRTGPFSSLITTPAINASGDVAFVGNLDAGGQGVGIYNGTTQAISIIPNPQPPGFTIGTEVGVNDAGRAVFRTGSPSGGDLFTATPQGTDLVLSKGMPLFGGILSDFSFFRNGFNNAGQVAFDYRLVDGTHGIALATPVPEPNSVVGRHLFYNNSKFDGDNGAAGSADDAAIAPDRTALLPGETSSFVNYTSFNRGLNGIMVDIASLPGGSSLSADDFEFKVGNSGTTSTWTALAATPEVSIRPGAGLEGSDRVTLVWPTEAARNQWLQVTMKANANTGLLVPDVFYFGNAVGESGNEEGDYRVSILDELLARNNPMSVTPGATITNNFDYNRDGTVSVVDQLLARNNLTIAATELKQITVPSTLSASRVIAVPEPSSLVLAAISLLPLVGLAGKPLRRQAS